MKCPYCEVYMKKGVIQSAYPIFWSNKKNKLFFRANESKGDVPVTPLSLSGSAKEAYLCTSCKRIIIDL